MLQKSQVVSANVYALMENEDIAENIQLLQRLYRA